MNNTGIKLNTAITKIFVAVHQLYKGSRLNKSCRIGAIDQYGTTFEGSYDTCDWDACENSITVSPFVGSDGNERSDIITSGKMGFVLKTFADWVTGCAGGDGGIVKYFCFNSNQYKRINEQLAAVNELYPWLNSKGNCIIPINELIQSEVSPISWNRPVRHWLRQEYIDKIMKVPQFRQSRENNTPLFDAAIVMAACKQYCADDNNIITKTAEPDVVDEFNPADVTERNTVIVSELKDFLQGECCKHKYEFVPEDEK